MKPFAIIPVIALGILFQVKIRDFTSNWTAFPSEVTIIRNGFVAEFARALHAPVNFTPFVLRNGTLHCHPNVNYGLTPRQPIFIDMIRATLDSCLFGELPGCDGALRRLRRGRRWPRELPMMLFHQDGNGCDIMKRSDYISYPRFSWDTPATKYGDDWCNAISVPTYINWKAFRDMDPSKWDAKIKSNERKYPWSSKIDRAVWRGSTTFPGFYRGSELNEIPRGKLVQLSMNHPELIDAAFVNIVQYYKGKDDELRNQTIIAPRRMPFNEQMKYKAIIDIDGNSWSGRFASLLCTNSVVIKIDPDQIESFYAELKPMEHYIPASLGNITQVIEYVLLEENDGRMKEVVNAANMWCKKRMTGLAMIQDMALRLEEYETEFKTYMTSNGIDDVSSMATLLPLNDFVKCA